MSMNKFSDADTEKWLESVTHTLPFPDGPRAHTTFRLVWEKLDSLVVLNGYSRAEIVEWALEEVQLQKVEFDEAFKCVIAHLDKMRRKAWGID